MEPVPEGAVCAVRWPLGQAPGMIRAASQPTGTALTLPCPDSGSGDPAEAPPSPTDDPCHRWAASAYSSRWGELSPRLPTRGSVLPQDGRCICRVAPEGPGHGASPTQPLPWRI